MSSELRPCPACGGCAEVKRSGDRYNPILFRAECKECELCAATIGTSDSDTAECKLDSESIETARQTATQRWNSLPRRDDAAELVEALRSCFIVLSGELITKRGFVDALTKASAALAKWEQGGK